MKKPFTPTQTDVVSIPDQKRPHPLQKLSFPEVKVETTIPVGEDLSLIAMEMRELVLNNRPEMAIRRFYIPPVEYKPELKNLVIPAVLIAAGTIASQTKMNNDFIDIHRSNSQPSYNPFDDIAQYCVAPGLFVLDAFGDEKHHPVDQVFLMAISGGITAIPVRGLKEWWKEDRPDGGKYSFPSGHTAVAFVGAHMIYKEFKDSNKWMAYSGYTLATLVGAARVIHNRHWVCDVVAGAGFAILGTELAYLIYFPVRNYLTDKANDRFGKYIIVSPVIQPGALGLQLNAKF